MRFLPVWDRRKNELRQELESHLQMAVADRLARGEPPEQARAAALREMGNPPLIADVTRGQWGGLWAERLLQDLRYALRQLAKSRGYTATAILTLTLAIGANTAIFNMVYAILLRSLPVEHPEQIVQLKIQMGGPGSSPGEPMDNLTGKIYDVIQHQTLLSGMCAWSSWPLNLQDASGTRPVPTANLTGDCFRTLGLHAALGRLFDERDDKPGGGPEGYAVVLGYNYWRNHLGADPAIVGRSLDFQDKKGVVVGVLEPGFESVSVGDQPWIYVPSEITPDSRHSSGGGDHMLFGRVKDGVTAAQVQAQLDPMYLAWRKSEGNKNNFIVFDQNGKRHDIPETHLVAVPARTGTSYLRHQFSKPLYLIESLVGLCLLVACAYLATLAGTRALVRRRELAVRMALGASRGRIVLQLTCESLIISVAGSALGLLFAWAGGRLLVHMISQSGWAGSKLELSASPGGPVLLFSIGITVLTVLLSGIGPAWRASHMDPVREIKEGDLLIGHRRPRRISTWLVPLQIAVSLTVMFVAALMGTTVYRLFSIDPGFRTSGVTFVRADFMHRTGTGKFPAALAMALLERVRRAPGVKSASITQAHQFGGGMYMMPASSRLANGELREGQMVLSLTVASSYFDTMGIPLIAGRDLDDGKKQGAPQVCILSRSAADYFFPGQHAIGQFLDTSFKHDGSERAQVVGIAGDTLYLGLRGNAPHIVYQSFFARNWNPVPEFAVRASNSAAAASAVRAAFRDLAPDVSLDEPVTISQAVQAAMASERLVALLSGFFALLTLTLTAIGMYGLLNYSAVLRRKEIGVRIALGASRTRVIRLILREGLWMVLPGLALGAAGAWASSRFLHNLVYGVKPLDPAVCAVSLAVLSAAALLACILPARRAASVHPMEALRLE